MKPTLSCLNPSARQLSARTVADCRAALACSRPCHRCESLEVSFDGDTRTDNPNQEET